jgi:hypothetical protein
MKYVKILGLLAVAAAALMAFAASASATTVTSPTGTAATLTTGSGETHKKGTQIHAISEEGAVAGTSHVLLHNSNASIQCNSTVEGDLESQGAGVTAKGEIDILTFTNCTNGWTVTVDVRGSLEVHWVGPSGYNGTLTSSGATVTAVLHTIFGDITCRYATNATHIGTVTGGNPATLHIEAAIPFHSGGGLCGSGVSNWTGKYVTTGPLFVDQ